MTNPPHLPAAATSPSPNPQRALAHAEARLDLVGWVLGCLRMLRSDGRLTLIHRTDRLNEVLAALLGRAGEVIVFPLWPAMGRPAKRVLIHARKGARGPLRLAVGLALHDEGGAFCPWVEDVLRHGQALDLTGWGQDG